MSRLLTVGLFISILLSLVLVGCEFSASTANIASAVLASDEAGTVVTTEFLALIHI